MLPMFDHVNGEVNWSAAVNGPTWDGRYCAQSGEQGRWCMSTNVTPPEFVASHVEASAPHREAHSSEVAWRAVIGGAFVAAALYLILLALGAGFGLSAVSP
jgi:hypothetical protein